MVDKPKRCLAYMKAAENILIIGGSALLLSLSYLYPGLKFITIFALVPFLWRLIGAKPCESIMLGVSLGGMFIIGISLPEIRSAPLVFTTKFFGMSLIFASFAFGVNRIKILLGFNPVFIALLWLPLEYILKNLIHLNLIFTPGSTDSSLLLGVGSLFGILMISFFIILINALILVFVRQFRRCKECQKKYIVKKTPISFPKRLSVFNEYIWYYSLIPRSPPHFCLMQLNVIK